MGRRLVEGLRVRRRVAHFSLFFELRGCQLTLVSSGRIILVELGDEFEELRQNSFDLVEVQGVRRASDCSLRKHHQVTLEAVQDEGQEYYAEEGISQKSLLVLLLKFVTD